MSMFDHSSHRLSCLRSPAFQVLVLFSLIFLLAPVSPASAANDELKHTAPSLGQPLNSLELKQYRQHVFANGEGLPIGEGRAADGKALYSVQCAHCHGSAGQGGRAMELVGDRRLLNSEYPDKGIGVYWPHAPTLFEYIYRSMPPEAPASLSANQLYAVIAHLLVLNELWDENVVLDRAGLQSVKMPNVQGFVTIGR